MVKNIKKKKEREKEKLFLFPLRLVSREGIRDSGTEQSPSPKDFPLLGNYSNGRALIHQNYLIQES